ncbi:coproporphyrinogen III oxidase, anaerobic [Halothece sp. PCC 7418]|uniref:radical SAM family heme chaperone HemW n=1 Tax=Halothece sp. (strain PCC 7418) TaxID=65093 RepID=UPI0002A064FA|nr:radical SAM family heme chaperone HemW [Halothece sp. PCC 7418]AFZ42544.1 coproporphyrinogen III oxidase, anaerobic [Halothece sp. PCC 7418]
MISQASSAYIHIPFCRRRCYYCDFPISVLGDGGGSVNRVQAMERYVAVLCQEIRRTAQWFPSSGLNTVFFGGGTPSLLPVSELEKILVALDQVYTIAKDAEISIEIDPKTFDLDQLRAYQRLGINRYSLGVQAFQDELLAQMGRTHRVDDIYSAIAQFEQLGIDNFSLDLISGLPQQSLSQWKATLEKAIALSPPHLSCYDLIVEPKTVFDRQAEAGTLPLPADETSAQMYRLTQQQLTAAGYTHYEISNYAYPNHQCRHNRVYWENQSYYGFGMGAASFLGGQRLTRPRTRRDYSSWVQNLTNPNHELNQTINKDSDEQLLEILMLGLRLPEGIDLSAIAQQFGAEKVGQITQTLQPYFDQNCVILGNIDHDQWGQLKLTDPEGLLFSNTILADLFSAFSP